MHMPPLGGIQNLTTIFLAVSNASDTAHNLAPVRSFKFSVGPALFSRTITSNPLDPTASFAVLAPLRTSLLMKPGFAVVVRAPNAVLWTFPVKHILDIHDPFIAAATESILIAGVVETSDSGVDSC